MMKDAVGIYSFTIDAYLSDFRGKATLPMIGGFMLQAATKHAEERGFGYSEMTQKDRVWVLTRMNIVIYEYPKNDVDIKVHTWISDVSKYLTERCFAFEDNEGKYFGYTRSLWMSIDINSRRPTNLLELQGLSDYTVDKECPIPSASKIGVIDEGQVDSSFTVKYSDIDINKHLNSIKYIEHFVDIFPLQMYEHKQISNIEINYIAESKYGTKMDIMKSKIDINCFILEMKDQTKTVCSSRITWADIN